MVCFKNRNSQLGPPATTRTRVAFHGLESGVASYHLLDCILSIDKDLKSVGLDTGLIHQLNELKFLLRFLRFGNPRLLLQ